MKISEAIKELKSIMEKHGDLPLIIQQDGFGGHAEHTVSHLQHRKMFLSSTELSEEYSLSDEQIKELIPEWNSDDEICGDIDTIVITTKSIISAT